MTNEHPVDRIFALHRAAVVALFDRFQTGYDPERAQKSRMLGRRALPLLIAHLAHLAAVDDEAPTER